MNNARMCELKFRYIDMLESEGCLNEILFDRPDLDYAEGHNIANYGMEKLVAMIPDDVIFRMWGSDCLSEEEFVA